MAEYKIKDSELKKLVEEVGNEVVELLKSESQKTEALAKNSDSSDSDSSSSDSSDSSSSDSSSSDSSSGSDSSDSSKSSGSSSDSSSGGEKAMAADAPMPEVKADTSGSSGSSDSDSSDDMVAPTHPAETGDPAQEMMDPAALKEEYKKLGPDQLKMHYQAAKEALLELMGEGGEAEAPAAPAPEEAMKNEEGMSKEASMVKEEVQKSEKNQSEALAKSEAQAKEFENLKNHVEVLTKALDLVLTQPLRKAVTSVNFVPKTEAEKPVLSKEEINAKLIEITKSPDLKKSDRELIDRFYNRSVSVDKLEHLLK